MLILFNIILIKDKQIDLRRNENFFCGPRENVLLISLPLPDKFQFQGLQPSLFRPIFRYSLPESLPVATSGVPTRAAAVGRAHYVSHRPTSRAASLQSPRPRRLRSPRHGGVDLLQAQSSRDPAPPGKPALSSSLAATSPHPLLSLLLTPALLTLHFSCVSDRSAGGGIPRQVPLRLRPRRAASHSISLRR